MLFHFLLSTSATRPSGRVLKTKKEERGSEANIDKNIRSGNAAEK
jgi:hypothetical protein